MLDLAAAAAAAREVLENAPIHDNGDGTSQPAVSLSELAQAVLKAANPEALVIPTYDAALAQHAHYRIEPDLDSHKGAHMTVTAHPGAVALATYAYQPKDAEPGSGYNAHVLTSGLVSPDAVWHFGLALCSAAMEAKRLRAEGK